MRTLPVLICGIVIGLAVAFAIVKLGEWKNQLGVQQADWFVCTHVNMDIISDALQTYVRTNNSDNPVSLETLVKAKLLPEWSEIYICPSQFGIKPLRSYYNVNAIEANMFTTPSLAARYSNCPYYIETLRNEYRVRCKYYTNELGYTVSMTRPPASKLTSKRALTVQLQRN